MVNGGEFKKEFTQLCVNMGMKRKTSHPLKPKSNVILERIHQVLVNGLQVFDFENMDIDPNEEDPFNEYLQLVAYAIRGAYHQTQGHSLTQMVFGRDMFFPIDSQIDWETIAKRKQERIRGSN